MLSELQEFRKFKKTYQFVQLDIVLLNGVESCLGYPLYDKEGKCIGECKKWVNVGYRNSGSLPKVLSNLFPYEFKFRGKKIRIKNN